MPLPVGRAAHRARPPVRKRERFEPLTKSLVVMQPPKHGGVNLEVWSSIYRCSESLVKRMSAANIDLQNPWEVRKYLRDHARSQTREAVEKSEAMLALEMHTGERSMALIKKGFYAAAIATQHGVRKETDR
jgi:hypothetical protein